jgi:8-oxo-dGTP pyrophosphatase MutT (NUDIX family)
MPVAIPRAAATVVVLRGSPGAAGFEVLMVRRHDQVAFMGGAYVFPGGRVDDSDAARAQALMTGTAARSRFPDLTAGRELVHRVAAVRELLEEAGVRIEPSALVPFAHWVTPEVETRRYDTRFFAAEMPPDQEAQHDEGEMTDLAWLSPADAIARCLDDAILLPPPTWTTLKRLAQFGSVGEVLSWALATRIVTIQPSLVRDEQKTMLTLPGDPTYPPIEGWDVPEDTRFLLRDGRWRPVPA